MMHQRKAHRVIIQRRYVLSPAADSKGFEIDMSFVERWTIKGY
jgi:hypothetical protein